MTTDTNILPLIARSGIAEDELLEFLEGELSSERSAAVIRALADHPDLSRIVMAMRGDRSELSHEFELDLAPADPLFVESSVELGVTGELDAAMMARLEAASGGTMPHMHVPHRSSRRVACRRAGRRTLRFPARAVGGLLAACVAAAFFGAVWLAWPTTPTGPGNAPVAEATASASPSIDSVGPADTPAADASAAIAGIESVDALPAEWGPTTTITTPAEALAAAEEGRLVIRVYSPDASRGRSLVESITMAPSVSRVAVLEGRLADHEADRIASAIPVPTGPVYAGDPAGIEAAPLRVEGRASWVYMLEVEPTERGMSLLLAGLSREPGMLVELVRSGEPVTTPGSAGDVSWFRKPSRDWTRRIAAPVVVQSGER